MIVILVLCFESFDYGCGYLIQVKIDYLSVPLDNLEILVHFGLL